MSFSDVLPVVSVLPVSEPLLAVPELSLPVLLLPFILFELLFPVDEALWEAVPFDVLMLFYTEVVFAAELDFELFPPHAKSVSDKPAHNNKAIFFFMSVSSIVICSKHKILLYSLI